MLDRLKALFDPSTGLVLVAAGGSTATTLSDIDLLLKISIDLIALAFIAIKLLRLLRKK